ncbi:MAG: hypothetical protein B7X48_02055 [Acidiphilium sp. 34-60-192]|nr:MAG: hypothetical protein B7X48_02055 [Acidiphilium sp. 34-60-192]
MIIEFRFREFDYEYGVIVHGKVVSEEWLFRTSQAGKEAKLFERTSTKTEKGFITNVSAGSGLRKMKSPVDSVGMDKYLEILSTGLKETRPFLSEANERELPLLAPAYEWIVNVLTPVTATSNYAPLFERVNSDNEFRAFLQKFMKTCDVGIEELRVHSIKFDDKLFSNIPANIKEKIHLLENDTIFRIEGDDGVSVAIERDDKGDLIVKRIGAIRLDPKGKKIDFSFDEESSGTRRLLDLAPMLAESEVERIYVVDELDRKLHPMLSYKFVEEFLKKRRDQLILTTHNTHLMDLDLLRRDEIWFVQKRNDGSSDLYSLAEMKIRPDLNVEKGYINGRFGAIPFLGAFPDIKVN